jgi:hypothetical protein
LEGGELVAAAYAMESIVRKLGGEGKLTRAAAGLGWWFLEGEMEDINGFACLVGRRSLESLYGVGGSSGRERAVQVGNREKAQHWPLGR